MLFNTAQFFVFLVVVLALFYLSPARWRRVLLLVASYWFYGTWNVRFIPLLAGLTVIDYTAALWIERKHDRSRRVALIVSLAANLGVLGFFKYFNFLAGNVAALAGLPPNRLMLDIILPLGISFHTFQSMSYVVDVYRGQRAIRNFLDYSLFIVFFPQLVAGPIVRAHEFFADLYAWRAPNAREVLRGIMLVTLGLTKKMVFADQFALVSDAYFKNVAAHTGAVPAWSGALAFGMQVYFDFSGYTDMAIGMALLLGFHFPLNFRRPYLSASVTEFWQRWHISLSRWLRDYLYIPLGGNRHGTWKTYRNLILTMLLGGLWHGANWTYVVWGGYHGVVLAMERALGVDRLPKFLRPLRWAVMLFLVTLAWPMFRASTFGDAAHTIRQMFTLTAGQSLLAPWHYGLILAAFVVALTEEHSEWMERLDAQPAWAYGATIAGLLLCLELIAVTDVAIPFVYFQF